jgi:hypothetical protein
MDLQFLYENRFTAKPMEENPQEEILAQDWEKLIGSHTGADWMLLRKMCVELSFSVKEGQSENPELSTARKRGVLPFNLDEAWIPEMPEGVHVYLHQTPAGRLPVIECRADADFIRLQQSLVYRCEPKPISDSRGASIIKNYNNWVRVEMHRENGAIPKDPAMYRDYIMLLSHRYYSGVEPEVFGLEEDNWRRKSLVIRREHEAAHYMTQRYYHSTKNEIHDEIIADFMGVTAAFGEYDPDMFLIFMGLDSYTGAKINAIDGTGAYSDSSAFYRKGGRLENYMDELPTAELCETLAKAAKNVAIYHTGDRIQTFHTLCRTSVANMARGDFHECL